MVAHFVFILLILITFVVFLQLGIKWMGHFLTPTTNPYLVYGVLTGNTPVVISQDPKDSQSVTIQRSNNQETGIEFTWSVWLLLGTAASTTAQAVFVKGSTGGFSAEGISTVNNGPGMYIKNNNSLYVKLDTMDQAQAAEITVDSLPIGKWCHVAIRLENMILDVYVNGVAAGKKTLAATPKQNFSNVLVCPNGGFSGSLSNLRYFNRSLNIFELSGILYYGPTLSSSALSNSSASVASDSSYLSSLWYMKK